MRKTLIMFVMALLLAGYVYFYEIKGGEERQAQKEQNEKLVALKKDSINVLDIRGAKGHFHFVKNKTDWWLDTPLKTQADNNTVNGFLSTLTNAKKIRTFDAEKKDWGKYGLSMPYLHINARTMDKHDSVRVGDNTGIGSNVFASKGDTLIFLTASSLKNGADKSLFDWRDKRVLLFKRSAVNEIRLKNSHGVFAFENAGNGWQMTRPIKTRADDSAINALLSKLDNGRMKKVEDEAGQNLKSFKLSKPRYHVSFFEGTNKTESRLILSAVTDSKIYAKDNVRPMVFSVGKDFIKPIDKSLFDFRNKKIANISRSDVDRVDWSLNGSTNSAVKDSSGSWILNNSDTLETFKMNSLLNSIGNLKASAFYLSNGKNLKRYGLKNPTDKIALYKDGTSVLNLNFGKTMDKKRFVLKVKPRLLVSVEESSLKNVLKPADEYKKKK